MKRALTVCGLTATILLGALASLAAAAEFDHYRIESASASLSDSQAGAHADFTTSFTLSESGGEPYALTRDIIVHLPPGLLGNPEGFPKCTTLQLGTDPTKGTCPIDSQIGSMDLDLGGERAAGIFEDEPIYNMPSPGGDIVARFGFYAAIYSGIINVRYDSTTNSLVAAVESAPSGAGLLAATVRFWGVPGAKVHDSERLSGEEALTHSGPPGGHPSTLPENLAFMSNPTSCEAGQEVNFLARSYQLPGQPSTVSAPFPQITGCGLVGFSPSTSAKPTTTQGTTGTGLDYGLSFPTTGLEFSNLNLGSEIKRAEVSLPVGMTVNPSEAEGLGVCTEEDLARETYNSAPNVGCPETSKIGSVEAITPEIDRNPTGSLYLAKPYANPFGSLIALYMVLKIPDRGVLVTMAGKVTTDPETGQITTVFDESPQVPVKEFKLHFREGARAPLITPAACGSYTTVSRLTPWSAPGGTLARESSFQIESGPNHGSCPTGGLPPFNPDLLAGTQNNAAGTYSPFDLKITRNDAEQEITHFSIKLPPGVTGRLAGIPFCPDASIAAAQARKGPHGGEEELSSPSCPGASQIGTTLVGAGVGDVLTYVPGKVYLAGPYHGSPLSIVAITAAKAGPFDLGTVVVREALKVNPETAEVSVDAAGSDPIPHIIQGIPVHLRDIRVYVDRPEFMLNPTSCERTSVASTVLGSGLDFASETDDRPVTVTTPFQAADCAALDFRPRLKLSLKGPTKRTGLPRLKAVVAARPGDANIGRAVVTLPKSEFLEQGHIGNTCTRVQFNEGGGNGEHCPKRSLLGHARAWTPLLAEPLEGPVFLRSNGGERKLPDMVAALHSTDININLIGYISSVHHKGSDVSRIRTIFANVPDAPVSRFVLEMFGGKRGLLINSANLCQGKHRAISTFVGQNGKRIMTRPVVHAQCKRRHHKKKHPAHRKAKKKSKRGRAGRAFALRRGVGW